MFATTPTVHASFGRIARYLIIILAIAVPTYAGWNWWLFTGGVFSTSRFDSSTWHMEQTNETDKTCFRGSMANDIKSRILKKGQSRTAVKSLLGEPDREESSLFEYSLGMCSGLRIDFDSLNVVFGESGLLTSVGIVQH